ncbi:MAG: nucleotidyltransferase substrate-binding protein [Rhodospirillaceae bacterium]|nr:MAG: nucleotidyltransferase substrate-binding protein [Rhodospirillaceae bacterium]
MQKDVRWEQRFQNFDRAVLLLRDPFDRDINTLSALEKEGIIQRFEFTVELAWKTLKTIWNSKVRSCTPQHRAPSSKQPFPPVFLMMVQCGSICWTIETFCLTPVTPPPSTRRCRPFMTVILKPSARCTCGSWNEGTHDHTAYADPPREGSDLRHPRPSSRGHGGGPVRFPRQGDGQTDIRSCIWKLCSSRSHGHPVAASWALGFFLKAASKIRPCSFAVSVQRPLASFPPVGIHLKNNPRTLDPDVDKPVKGRLNGSFTWRARTDDRLYHRYPSLTPFSRPWNDRRAG